MTLNGLQSQVLFSVNMTERAANKIYTEYLRTMTLTVTYLYLTKVFGRRMEG